MDRRLFIASALASPLLAGCNKAPDPTPSGDEDKDALKKGIHVPAGQDRTKEPLKLGPDQIDVKVSTKDSNGGLYLFEGTMMGKGGPIRHVHLEQDEWFYILKGEFWFEVGDEKITAKPGDSVFGPRKVPHVWACVSDKGGRLLIAVTTAGTTEEFFQKLAKFTERPTEEELDKLHEAHRLKVVGPPLKID
jgi:quercetin dioxygenase-like cupin family protein